MEREDGYKGLISVVVWFFSHSWGRERPRRGAKSRFRGYRNTGLAFCSICHLGSVGEKTRCSVCHSSRVKHLFWGSTACVEAGPLCGLAATFWRDPRAGSGSVPAWHKPWDCWMARLGGSVFCYGHSTVSLLRLKFLSLSQNVWLLRSASWLAGGKVNLCVPGNELCISILLDVVVIN